MYKLTRVARRTAATGALFALAGATFIPSAPVATAAETCDETHLAVTGGTFNWGVKESWRNYVKGNIAKGSWTTQGVRDAGSTFAFTPVTGEGGLNANGTGTVYFDGSIRFTGHSGALDMTLSDFAVQVDGNKAGIQVDYVTYETDFQTSGHKGTKVTGNDVVIATVNLKQKATSSTLNLTGTTSLTAAGADLFANYSAGTAMDPTSGSLSLDEACGTVGTGSGTTGGAGRATEGMGGLVAGVNDTLSEVNTLMGNADELMTNSENLYNRTWSNNNSGGTTSGSGATGKTGTGGTTTSTGTGTTGTAPGGTTSGGPTSGTTGTASAGKSASGASNGSPSATAASASTGGSSASAGTSGTGDLCTADSSLGVTQAQAAWGIRSSFRNYITGSIANGGWELSGVGYDNGQFQFTGDSGAVDTSTKTGTILYPGAIRFTGHGGTLDTRFSNMEIQFEGNSGSLLVNASSNSTEGEPNDYGRVVLATLSFSSLDVTDSSLSGSATPHLTEAGARAFGDFYPAGDALDPISFQASLGGGSSCVSGQGAAATGSADGSGSGAAAAAEMRTAALEGADEMGGSVFDEVDAEGNLQSASADEAGGNPFNIRSTAAGSSFDQDRKITFAMLILAAFVVAGATMTSFVRRNPNLKKD